MNDTLLRNTLQTNAAISLTWGVVAIAGAAALAEPLGVPRAAMLLFGAIAVVAALLFGTFGRRRTLRAAEGWLATAGDAVFGGTLVVAALAAPDMTMLGRWVVAISGVAVLDLALLEFVGTRQLHRDDDTAKRGSLVAQP